MLSGALRTPRRHALRARQVWGIPNLPAGVARSAGLHRGQRAEGIHDDAGGQAIILVIVGDPRTNRRVAGLQPTPIPLNARRPGGGLISPLEAAIDRQGLDRQVLAGPLSVLAHDLVEINHLGARKESHDVGRRAHPGILAGQAAIGGGLVLAVLIHDAVINEIGEQPPGMGEHGLLVLVTIALGKAPMKTRPRRVAVRTLDQAMEIDEIVAERIRLDVEEDLAIADGQRQGRLEQRACFRRRQQAGPCLVFAQSLRADAGEDGLLAADEGRKIGAGQGMHSG